VILLGGTFFEALTVGDGESIQIPTAPGHAIIHKTTQRHAGAPTTSGVRDILVIFLTARRTVKSGSNENTWRIERAMRLQSIGKELEREKLIPSLRLARDNDPTNSEVPYWLGVHLIQGDMNDESDERWAEISQGVESLKLSTLLNPADARAHYHLGMAISARHKYAMRTKRAHLLPPAKEAGESVIDALETAIRLERNCTEAGCENGINISAAYLALGDFMARLKSYDRAITYLNQVESIIRENGDLDRGWAQSMLEEVSSITEYCQREAANEMEPSLVR
jgi:tetratricopeptide (TPR) repeat protein